MPRPGAQPRRGGIVAPSSCNILYLSLYGPAEAEGDAVGEGDGEAVGDAVGVLLVVGPIEGAGVVVAGAVFSGRAGGSYGPLSAADNAAGDSGNADNTAAHRVSQIRKSRTGVLRTGQTLFSRLSPLTLRPKPAIAVRID